MMLILFNNFPKSTLIWHHVNKSIEYVSDNNNHNQIEYKWLYVLKIILLEYIHCLLLNDFIYSNIFYYVLFIIYKYIYISSLIIHTLVLHSLYLLFEGLIKALCSFFISTLLSSSFFHQFFIINHHNHYFILLYSNFNL